MRRNATPVDDTGGHHKLSMSARPNGLRNLQAPSERHRVASDSHLEGDSETQVQRSKSDITVGTRSEPARRRLEAARPASAMANDVNPTTVSLITRATHLGNEQHLHAQTAIALENKVKEGDLACGRMLQASLDLQSQIDMMNQQMVELQKRVRDAVQKKNEISQAINLRMTHVNDDRKKLVEEKRLQEQNTQEILAILREIDLPAASGS